MDLQKLGDALAQAYEEYDRTPATLYASSSTREGSRFADAAQAYGDQKHQQLLQTLGSKSIPAIGVWADGAEESVASQQPADTALDVARQIAHQFNQKAVAVFTPGDHKGHTQHVITLAYPRTPEDVHTHLLRSGLQFATYITPNSPRSVEQVHLLTDNQEDHYRVGDFVQRLKGVSQYDQHPGRVEFVSPA